MVELPPQSYDNAAEDVLETVVGHLEKNRDIKHMVVIMADQSGGYIRTSTSVNNMQELWLLEAARLDLMLEAKND